MQLGQSLAHEIPNSIVLIKPLERSSLKICLWVGVSIAIAFLISISSIKLAMLIMTTLLIVMYYLVCTHNRLVPFCFFRETDRNSENVTHFAIINAHNDCDQGRVYIVKVHYKKQNANFFHFNEILFKVVDQTVEVANEIDLLDMLKIQSLDSYKTTGLNKQRIQMSESLYGKQKGFIAPSRWQMTLRKARYDKQWMILILVTVLTAILWNWQIFLILLIIDLTSGVIVYIEQQRSAASFTQRYEWIAKQQFRVIREGEQQSIAFQQILVGDLMVLSKDEQNDEQKIFFKSLLISTEHQIIVKQGMKEVGKFSLRDRGSYIDRAHLEKFVIRSQSIIQNSELSSKQYLVVADNQSISRFFSLWFQKSQGQHFSKLFKDKQKHAAYLMIGCAVFLLVLCLVLKIAAGTFTQQFDKSIIDQIFLSVLSLPSVIYLLFCLNGLIAYRKLSDSGIKVFGNGVQESGLVNNILLDFSDLVTLEMSQVLTKYQIFDSSIPPFYPDADTLRNGASYESLLALILYISLGNFQKRETFLKKVYDGFSQQYKYQPSTGSFDDVEHVGSDKKWQILGHYPEVGFGWRSWLIRYNKKTSYVILEGNFKQDSKIFQNLIGSKEDKTKLDVYLSTAQSLLEEGKNCKLMFFKSFKEKDRADRVNDGDIQNQDLQTTEFSVLYDPKTVDRQRLQKNLQFGAFIIFDNAIKTQSIKVVKELSNSKTQDDKKLFNITFYSSRGRQTMAGFEHLLTNVPFVYELSQIDKYRLVCRKTKQGGTLVIGDHEDQFALQSASVSVQIEQHVDGVVNRLLVPSDICLKDLTSLTTLLDTGNWIVLVRLQTIKFAMLVTMSQIMALLFLGTRGDYAEIDYSLLWGISQQLLFILLPLVVINFIPVNSLLCSKSKYNILTITFVVQTLVVCGMTVVLIVAASSNSICPSYITEKQDHQMLRLRTHFTQSNEKDCLNIPLMVSATSGVILFSIIYLQQNWIVLSQELWRYLIVVLWVGVMLISNLPINLFWIGLCLLAVLVMLKYFFKLTVLKPQQKEPQQL